MIDMANFVIVKMTIIFFPQCYSYIAPHGIPKPARSALLSFGLRWIPTKK